MRGSRAPVRARALMILGTGSHVGKSLLTAALCRVFYRDGVNVAPFKAQNMSLNSAATPEGYEIGRAQALQAEAAGVAPSVDMNPILLKPSGNMTSQVIVRGRIWGQVGASDYHLRRVEELFPLVCESYEALAARHDLIVLEGAGSPAEINLKQHDIVNMRMAEAADAACLLVGDIDRGGVFAALYGTIMLLESEEQTRIRGFIVNKFRGDLRLLTPGLRMMEARIHKPCLGTIPWLPALTLDEEDSLGLPHISDTPWTPDDRPERRLRIAVLALPSLANFTDFDSLRAEPSLEVRLVRSAETLSSADVVILPGSKQTADDLTWLREQGLEPALKQHAASGLLIGICGGFQMLGQGIDDPSAIEFEASIVGLGLLPIRTVMHPAKKTEPASGMTLQPTLFGQPIGTVPLTGYEIHIGQTVYGPSAVPFACLADGDDGCISADGRVLGTYLHGLFDGDAFRHAFVTAARGACGLASATARNDWKAYRERELNRFADVVETALDMEAIYALTGRARPPRAVRP